MTLESGKVKVDQRKLEHYLDFLTREVSHMKEELAAQKLEFSRFKRALIEGIKPYEEVYFDADKLENLSNLRLKVLQTVLLIWEETKRPVTEQQVYNVFTSPRFNIPIKNPSTIGVRLRELAALPNYARWYGQLLLRSASGRFFPNPEPPLKLIVKDCRRAESCAKCETLAGCIRIALRGKEGRA